jgi:hypothetical protein
MIFFIGRLGGICRRGQIDFSKAEAVRASTAHWLPASGSEGSSTGV